MRAAGVRRVGARAGPARRRCGRPGNLDSPGAHVARDVLLAGLPKVVAEERGRAARIRRSSSTCTARSSSCARSASTPRAAARSTARPRSARPRRSTLDWETYVRLACGRVTPAAVAGPDQDRGRPELAEAILRTSPSRRDASRDAPLRPVPHARDAAVAAGACPRRGRLAPASRPHTGTCTASTRLATSRSRSRRAARAAQPQDLADAERLQDEDRGEGDPVVVAGRVQQHADRRAGSSSRRRSRPC